MKFCEKHWKKVMEGFGHSDVQNLEERLGLVTKEMGFDPWFMTVELVMAGLLDRVNPIPFKGSVANLANTIEMTGGCPICFINDEIYLDDCIHAVKGRNKTPSYIG